MACNIPSVPIPVFGGAIQITTETVTTLLAIAAAYYFLQEFEEDFDRLKDLSEEYLAMGEEYCEAAKELRQRSVMLFNYVRSLPEYVPHGNYAQEGYAATQRAVFDTMSVSMRRISGDDVGKECEVKEAAAKVLLEHGQHAMVDGDRYERTLQERYAELIVKARTDAISQTVPNIARELAAVADTLSRSAQENSDSFNGALYVAGRGIGTLAGRVFGTSPGIGIA